MSEILAVPPSALSVHSGSESVTRVPVIYDCAVPRLRVGNFPLTLPPQG